MSRYDKIVPTLTVGDVRRAIADVDDRAEFKVLDPANPQGDPLSTATVSRAIGNRGEALVIVRTRPR
jgi:hypothetical protein